jgi:hypothetical protein
MKFGRRIEFDERSRAYAIRALIGDKPRRSYTWSCGIVLDQGDEGACTGFSVAHEAAARPVSVLGVNNDIARQIYHRARELDEWPGEDYEGSSVLAAMKAGAERRWYKEYRWAFGEEDLSLAVGYKGPAVLGTYWTEGMCYPDEKGIIKPSGTIVGGHAYMVNGYNVKTGLYRIHNSWGAGWGINGECFISGGNLALLLADQGEACIPVVRTKP